MVKSGVAARPVPLKFTICGLPGALSRISMEAVSAPPTDGVKTTEIEHWLLAANVPVQLEVAEKSAAFVPVFTELLQEGRKREAFRLASTIFWIVPAVSVTVSAGLAVPTFSSGKTKPAGLTTKPDPAPIFEINASQFPPGFDCSGFASGKSTEQVCPATYADPLVSTAIP